MSRDLEAAYEQARIDLGLVGSVVKCSPEGALELERRAMARFVEPDCAGHWWWEALVGRVSSVEDNQNVLWRSFGEIVPNTLGPHWLIPGYRDTGVHLAYSASLEHISMLVGELSLHEFYIVDRDFGWMLCVNHHDFYILVESE